jgi:hypothetical protein
MSGCYGIRSFADAIAYAITDAIAFVIRDGATAPAHSSRSYSTAS